ncbi:MAG: prepilin-type N-terminal cleavage/methylation domain-containing protein [Phycisphaeraceae bacterium]|nr:prepilin-type N-terminal cleavage/methylation domain-containing protein [Phycisphaeraceae bacterium]
MPNRKAFTLVELLVVIAIIAILLAIIIPALGGARTIARRTATQALMSDLSNAISQFAQDNSGRMPGYFSQQTIGGNPQNQGLTVMENAMLELGGSRQITSTNPFDQGGDQAGQSVPIAGQGNEGIKVNPDLIGVGDDVYFVPPPKNYVAQPVGKQVGNPGATANEGEKQLPDIVDFFGSPILLWIENESAPRSPGVPDEFASNSSQGGVSSKFYWRANEGFLASTSLGKLGKDQTAESLIGSGVAQNDRGRALTGLLGDPKYPMPTNFNQNNVLPGSARGRFVIHSAGADGVFLGRSDRGGKRLPSNDPVLNYAWNFFVPGSGNKYTDSKGAVTVEDILEAFDDVFVSGGN